MIIILKEKHCYQSVGFVLRDCVFKEKKLLNLFTVKVNI